MSFLLLWLTTFIFQGHTVSVTLRSDEKYTGIFSSASNEQQDTKYLLKMVKKAPSGESQRNASDESGAAYVGHGPDFMMVFPSKDVVNLSADNVRLERPKPKAGQNGKLLHRLITTLLTLIGASRFKTDTDISRGFSARERDLQKWEPGPITSVDLSLGNANGKPWDQFEANERLYGLKTNYDESFYTTVIDKAHPEYEQRAAHAERLAREIEGSASMNAHVAEERGLKLPDDHGEDEEEK
jgi:hypothetical protein